MPTTTDHPRVESELGTPICPTCGCSLARLGVSRENAAPGRHEGTEYLFCCEGCREIFATVVEHGGPSGPPSRLVNPA